MIVIASNPKTGEIKNLVTCATLKDMKDVLMPYLELEENWLRFQLTGDCNYKGITYRIMNLSSEPPSLHKDGFTN